MRAEGGGATCSTWHWGLNRGKRASANGPTLSFTALSPAVASPGAWRALVSRHSFPHTVPAPSWRQSWGGLGGPWALELHRGGQGACGAPLPGPSAVPSARRVCAEAGGLHLGGRAGLRWPQRLSAAVQVHPGRPAALHGGPQGDLGVGGHGVLSAAGTGVLCTLLVVLGTWPGQRLG